MSISSPAAKVAHEEETLSVTFMCGEGHGHPDVGKLCDRGCGAERSLCVCVAEERVLCGRCPASVPTPHLRQ